MFISKIWTILGSLGQKYWFRSDYCSDAQKQLRHFLAFSSLLTLLPLIPYSGWTLLPAKFRLHLPVLLWRFYWSEFPWVSFRSSEKIKVCSPEETILESYLFLAHKKRILYSCLNHFVDKLHFFVLFFVC